MTQLFAYRNTEKTMRRSIQAPEISPAPQPIKTKGRLALIELSAKYERERMDAAAKAEQERMDRFEELRAVEISNFHSEWAVEAKETAKHHTVRPSQIMAEVADKHGIHVADIISQARHKSIMRARKEATVRIYVECRTAFGARLSLSTIGRLMRRSDHTAIRRILMVAGVYPKPQEEKA